MTSTKQRVVILVTAIAIIAGMLACGSGGLVGREETTATPTKTPKPTFTATPIATDTPIPTDTPLPTPTPTIVPPTNTPVILTATPTLTPTVPPTPIPPTATTKPTARPTTKPKPKPTATKTPIPPTPKPAFEFAGVPCPTCPGQNNCGTTGVKGTIYSRSNAKMAGLYVAVWTDGWEGTVAIASDSAGAWNVFLKEVPIAGTWHVRLVDPATCQPKSPKGSTPSAICTGWRSDEVVVSTTTQCVGQGAVNWAVVDFKQN